MSDIDLDGLIRKRRQERWKEDFALGMRLLVEDPVAFAELAARCTEEGDVLTSEEALARFDSSEKLRADLKIAMELSVRPPSVCDHPECPSSQGTCRR